MCGIESVAALALTAASTAAKQKAANDVTKARNAAAAAEAKRQSGYQDIANGALKDVLAEYAAAPGRMLQDSSQQAQAVMVPAARGVALDNSMPVGTSSIAGEAMGRSTTNAIRQSSNDATARANMGAFQRGIGDLLLSHQRKAEPINRMADYSQRSAGLLDNEYAAANQKGQEWATIGDILGGAGQAAGAYAATRTPPKYTNNYGTIGGKAYNGPR